MEGSANIRKSLSKGAPHPKLHRKLINTRRFLDGALVEPKDMVAIEEFNSIVLKKQRKLTLDFNIKSIKAGSGTLKYRSLPPQIRALTVLIDFNNCKEETSSDTFRKRIFGLNTQDPSVRDYYREVSNGALDFTGDVYGWFTADHEISHYNSKDHGIPDDIDENPDNNGAQLLVVEAVKKAVAANNIDLSKYVHYSDNNERCVDFLIIVHAGNDSACDITDMDSFWSHQCELNVPIDINGIKIKKYVFISEYNSRPYGTIGMCCHELGHLFGLPDLYDTNYKTGGVGNWCLMSEGQWNDEGIHPAHLCAWAKAQLGWIKVDEVNQSNNPVESINNLWDGNLSSLKDAYLGIGLNETILDTTLKMVMVEKNVDATAIKIFIYKDNDKEYFLIENRQQEGFDVSLPSNGILIWHVDEAKKNNDTDDIYSQVIQGKVIHEYDIHKPFIGESDTPILKLNLDYQPLVMLEQADGKWDLMNYCWDNLGDAGDPYPGSKQNHEFSTVTNPSSRGYGRNIDYLVKVIVHDPSGPIMNIRVIIKQYIRVRGKPKKQYDINPKIIVRHVFD